MYKQVIGAAISPKTIKFTGVGNSHINIKILLVSMFILFYIKSPKINAIEHSIDIPEIKIPHLSFIPNPIIINPTAPINKILLGISIMFKSSPLSLLHKLKLVT